MLGGSSVMIIGGVVALVVIAVMMKVCLGGS